MAGAIGASLTQSIDLGGCETGLILGIGKELIDMTGKKYGNWQSSGHGEIGDVVATTIGGCLIDEKGVNVGFDGKNIFLEKTINF